MFKESNCDLCGDCLDRCYSIDFGGKENAAKEFEKLIKGEKVEWLHDCITCMACSEFCPQEAHPFDLILQRLEEDGNFTDPVLVKQMADRFIAKKDPGPVEPKKWNMSLCVMTGNMPWAAQGQLFENEDLTILKGLPYFCNVLFTHMGNETIMRDRMQKMVENLAASGAKEIIFVHEDCYAAITNYAPQYGIDLPFKPVHMFEYLRDYLTENKDKIKKLNMKVAYQRPCASRHTPAAVEGVLNEIFELIGVERVARKYDGINALCCGVEVAGPNLKLFPRGKNYEPFRENNIQDAKDNGAEAVVYLCPMCYKTLNEKAYANGMNNYMISDICRLALGEELPEDKPK
jgi:Fe-S oxidoreductase